MSAWQLYRLTRAAQREGLIGRRTPGLGAALIVIGVTVSAFYANTTMVMVGGFIGVLTFLIARVCRK